MTKNETVKPDERLKQLDELAKRAWPKSRMAWNSSVLVIVTVMLVFVFILWLQQSWKSGKTQPQSSMPTPDESEEPAFVLLGTYDERLYYYSGPSGQVLRREPLTGKSETTFNLSSYRDHLWSPNRTQIAVISNQDNDSGHLYIVDLRRPLLDLEPLTQRGEVIPKAFALRSLSIAAWSPDEMHIAFVAYRNDESDIFVAKTDGSEICRITHNEEGVSSIAWIDTDTLAFVSRIDGQFRKFLIHIDGSGREEWR